MCPHCGGVNTISPPLPAWNEDPFEKLDAVGKDPSHPLHRTVTEVVETKIGRPRWEVYRCASADDDGSDNACGIREVQPGMLARMVVSDTNRDECCHHMRLVDARRIVDEHNGPPRSSTLTREELDVLRDLASRDTLGEGYGAALTKVLDAALVMLACTGEPHLCDQERIHALEARIERKDHVIDLAWGLIANTNGGDWEKVSPEWKAAAEEWRDEHFHPNVEEPRRLNAAEAVYGLLGWLTSRHEVTTLSSTHDSCVGVELAQQFIDANKLGDVSSAWPRNLTHPPRPVGLTTPVSVGYTVKGERVEMKSPTPEDYDLDSRDVRQLAVALWAIECFGEVEARDVPQRAIRLLEEAVELAQAAHIGEHIVHHLVQFVYGRPIGEVKQEVGGVSCTLLALCAALDTSADMLEQAEVVRVLGKPRDFFTQRNAAKNAAGFRVAP